MESEPTPRRFPVRRASHARPKDVTRGSSAVASTERATRTRSRPTGDPFPMGQERNGAKTFLVSYEVVNKNVEFDDDADADGSCRPGKRHHSKAGESLAHEPDNRDSEKHGGRGLHQCRYRPAEMQADEEGIPSQGSCEEGCDKDSEVRGHGSSSHSQTLTGIESVAVQGEAFDLLPRGLDIPAAHLGRRLLIQPRPHLSSNQHRRPFHDLSCVPLQDQTRGGPQNEDGVNVAVVNDSSKLADNLKSALVSLFESQFEPLMHVWGRVRSEPGFPAPLCFHHENSRRSDGYVVDLMSWQRDSRDEVPSSSLKSSKLLGSPLLTQGPHCLRGDPAREHQDNGRQPGTYGDAETQNHPAQQATRQNDKRNGDGSGKDDQYEEQQPHFTGGGYKPFVNLLSSD